MADTLEIFGTEYTGVAGIIATNDNDTDLTYIRPQGTKSISANGTGIDVAEYASVNVNVPSDAFIVTLSWDSVEELWMPDKTITALQDAYANDEEIIFACDDGRPVSWFYDDDYVFVYSVFSGGNNELIQTYYSFTTQGVEEVTADRTIVPVFESPSVTYTPTESQQTDTVTYNRTYNYNGMEEVFVTVNAISSTYVGTGITRRSSTDLTASGATVTVPSGYYSAQASKAVASGTAGTPTATKGSVSNHSISVTPSVTNTSGYITGSTINGTAVTVSASELVSGSETKTENGTYDVTNLAELVVDVQGGSVTWETIYNGNVTIVADSPNYVAINNWTPSKPALADGQTWRVTWNGTQYICPVEIGTDQAQTRFIGNKGLVGYTGDDSNEPFFGYMRTSTQLAFVTTDPSGTIPLKMELQQSSSATLIEKTITANGTYDAEDDDADGYSSVTVNVPSGSSKNVQVLQSTSRTSASSLTKVLGDLTVSKTGTYDIYWSGGRSNTSTSYTWGTRLYVDGTGYDTENTTWTNNCQSNHLSNVSLTANQKLSVYARGRTGSYYTFAPMLVIIEA